MPAEEEQQMTLAQIEIAKELERLTIRVSQEIITAIGQSFQMSTQAFLDTYIGALREELKELDARTILFLEKVTHIIDLHIKSLDTFPELLEVVAMLTSHENLSRELIKAKALPHVHNLIEGLDRIRPSIVDEILY